MDDSRRRPSTAGAPSSGGAVGRHGLMPLAGRRRGSASPSTIRGCGAAAGAGASGGGSSAPANCAQAASGRAQCDGSGSEFVCSAITACPRRRRAVGLCGHSHDGVREMPRGSADSHRGAHGTAALHQAVEQCEGGARLCGTCTRRAEAAVASPLPDRAVVGQLRYP
jgi:hypothetical protein